MLIDKIIESLVEKNILVLNKAKSGIGSLMSCTAPGFTTRLVPPLLAQ